MIYLPERYFLMKQFMCKFKFLKTTVYVYTYIYIMYLYIFSLWKN